MPGARERGSEEISPHNLLLNCSQHYLDGCTSKINSHWRPHVSPWSIGELLCDITCDHISKLGCHHDCTCSVG